jgi:hypothetical protein
MAGSSWTNQVQNQIIITGPGGGVYTYSPAPGAGTLVASGGLAAAGTDAYGNATLAGYTTYVNNNPAFHNWTATSLQNGQVAVYQATTEAGPWALLTSISIGQNSSLGPSTHLDIGSGGGTPVIFRDLVSSPHGFQGTLPIGKIDISTNAVGNTGTAGDITTAWAVPASDGQAGTTYTIRALATMTMGQTTAETLTLGADIDAGTLVPLATLGAVFNGSTLSATYDIPLELVLMVDAVSSNTPQIYLSGPLGNTSANRLSVNSANMAGNSNTATWTKTGAHTLAVYAQWGGTGGSVQTIQTIASRFTREGS